ncbi:hypothetical protein JKP88DRAFT_255501 [Tribonema minus]|uniref:Uncharacterized protein n=1 Tax=Tribonema minus TaxID=303371 RepID=A0A835YYT5_9STRA|nr:hypothetical protein JKP88DRAFT_255501 [Tribonema minus]
MRAARGAGAAPPPAVAAPPAAAPEPVAAAAAEPHAPEPAPSQDLQPPPEPMQGDEQEVESDDGDDDEDAFEPEELWTELDARKREIEELRESIQSLREGQSELTSSFREHGVKRAPRALPDITAGLNMLPALESRYLSRLPTICGFVGSTGSGKTYLCLSLLKLLRREGTLDTVYLVSPTGASNVLYKSVIREGKDHVFTKPNSPQIWKDLEWIEGDVQAQADRWRDEMEYDIAHRKHTAGQTLNPHETNLLERFGFRKIVPRRPCPALVIDDAQGSLLFSPSPRNYLSQLVLRCRHVGGGVGLSIFLVAQTSRGVPRSLRCNFTHLFLYSTHNAKELDVLYHESGGFVSREEFERLFRLYTATSRHAFMKVDLYERQLTDSL